MHDIIVIIDDFYSMKIDTISLKHRLIVIIFVSKVIISRKIIDFDTKKMR